MSQINHVLEGALQMAELGMRVFPIGENGIPLIKWGAGASSDPNIIEEWFTRTFKTAPAYGVATGKASGVVVLDVDGEAGLDDLRKLGPLPDTMMMYSAGGGRHYYFKYPDFDVGKGYFPDCTSVEVKGDGGCVTGPGSKHRDPKVKGSYVIEINGYQEPRPLPEHLAQALRGTSSKKEKQSNEPVEAITENRNIISASVAGKLWIQEVTPECHTELMHVWNRHMCVPPLDTDELKYTIKTAQTYKRNPRVVTVVETEPPKEPPVSNGGDIQIEADEVRVCTTSKKDLVAEKSLEFIIRVFKEDPAALGGRKLSFNLLTDLPHLGDAPLLSHDISPIITYLEVAYRKKLRGEDAGDRVVEYPRQLVRDAIVAVARERPFHPVRAYFRKLSWDGENRLERLPEDVLGVACTPIHVSFIKRFFVGCVARAMRPGCKNETMLVLIGDQGTFKSTFFESLVPDPSWFSRTTIDPSDKDSRVLLGTMFMTEWADLAGMGKRDIDALKSMLSTSVDYVRRPYRPDPVALKRPGVLVGTTNETDFLRDPTGNRRFWAINIPAGVKIDVETLVAMRDQLWAEAYVLWRAGEQWHLTSAEQALQVDLAEEHTEAHPLEAKAHQYMLLKGPAGTLVETTEIIHALFGDVPAEKLNVVGRQVSWIMRRIGAESARLTCSTRPRRRGYRLRQTTQDHQDHQGRSEPVYSETSETGGPTVIPIDYARRTGTRPEDR